MTLYTLQQISEIIGWKYQKTYDFVKKKKIKPIRKELRKFNYFGLYDFSEIEKALKKNYIVIEKMIKVEVLKPRIITYEIYESKLNHTKLEDL